MPATQAPAKVLVTGANGFVGSWIVRTLLEHGYSVRGTVRTERKSVHLRETFKDAVESGRLEFVVIPDMQASDAFDEAVKGVDGIVHTASPVNWAETVDPKALIDPAVNGTINILESARKNAGPQLKRIVITSSIAAVFRTTAKGHFDESHVNEDSIIEVREKGSKANQREMYFASKSLAEKAAWNFVSTHQATLTWDITTIIPPYIFGPVITEAHSPKDLNTTNGFFYDALLAKDKWQPAEIFAITQSEWVDVRDVAEGHVRALEIPEAGGERFILSSGPWVWHDFFDAATELKLPGINLPSGYPSTMRPQYDLRLDSTKARNVFRMEFRDKLMTTKDIIEDFNKRGW